MATIREMIRQANADGYMDENAEANDMCYLSDLMERDKLMTCLDTFVFGDSGMRENNMQDIRRRINNTFASKQYVSRLSNSKKNWLGMEMSDVLDKISIFLETL